MRVLITGINGQDGSHLADLLVARGDEVHGIVRRQAKPHYDNIQHLLEKEAIRLHCADLTDIASLLDVMRDAKPEQIYNLGAQSFVGDSYTQPEHTLNVTGFGPCRVFEAVRRCAPRARVYQASSSEMYGNVLSEVPAWRDHGSLNEAAPFAPESPYGAAKVLAHDLAHVYRKSYGLYIANGILFNHEGPKRGPAFVTRKITRGVARIKHGLQDKLTLGNLDAVRDWGYAPEYCLGMMHMLEKDTPGDYVLATGEGHSVAEFLAEAREAAGIQGSEYDSCFESVPTQRRPTDITRLVGDARKANVDLGWKASVKFSELVTLMVAHDLFATEHGA